MKSRSARRVPSALTLTLVAVVSASSGAGLMYLLDPQRGRRRRAGVRDRAVHVARQERDFFGKATRDLRHRLAGLVARAQHIGNDHPPDEVLVARVRSALGHHLTHPGAIEVFADDGVVTLRGPIFATQAEHLLRGVGRLRGVHKVVDQLERHPSAENIPALQGEGTTPQSLYGRQMWPPAYRLTALGVGLALGIAGVVRRGTTGTMLGTAGTLLALRATTNRPLLQLVGVGGVDRGIDIRKTIRVDRPVEEVFEFWSRPENFPRFMEHVLDVTMDEERQTAHWEVAGPANTTFGFDAEVTVFEPDEEYAWRTLPGSSIRHEGSVRFESIGPDSCRIHVHMTYQPPGGALGHAVASLFHKDPKHAIDDDLLRMKSLLEIGKTVARGQETQLEELQ